MIGSVASAAVGQIGALGAAGESAELAVEDADVVEQVQYWITVEAAAVDQHSRVGAGGAHVVGGAAHTVR